MTRTKNTVSTDPSRTLRAVLLALLMAGLGIAGVGFASPDEGPATVEPTIEVGAPAGPFGVPAPQHGDRGVYDLDQDTTNDTQDEHTDDDGHHHGHTDGGHDEDAAPDEHHAHSGDPHAHPVTPLPFGFAWLGAGEMYDAYGVHHWTHRLRLAAQGGTHGATVQFEDGPVYDVDQADRSLVAVTNWRDGGTITMQGTLTGDSETEQKIRTTRFMRPQDPDAEALRCGLWHPLQGGTIPLNESWTWPACDIQGVGAVQSARFVSSAHGTTDQGIRWVAYRPVNDSFDPAQPHVTRLVFEADAAYPVEMRIWSTPDVDPTTLHLSNLQVGHGGRLESRMSDEPGLPAPQFAPTPIWGLDDTGVDHAYPLSEAWASAVDDPLRPELRDFLDTHPNSYVSYFSSDRHETESDTTWSWTIEVRSGSDTLTVCPYKRVLTDPTGASPTSVEVPLREQDLYTDCPQILSPAPEVYEPAARPTAVSLQALWETLGPLFGLDQHMNLYEGMVREPWQPGGAPVVSIGFGHDGTSSSLLGRSTARVSPHDEDDLKHRFTLAPDGALGFFHSSVEQTTFGEEEGASSPAISGAHHAQAVDPTTRETHLVDQWNPPAARDAGAIGLTALLLAALYWSWPWLKHLGVAGLFSRIQRPAALDHKRRALVAEVITARPGVHRADLARITGLADGTLRHHLAKLVDTGLVGVRRTGGFVCYYPAEGTDVRRVEAQALLKSDLARRLVQALQADDACTVTELAARLGSSPQSIAYHIDRLEHGGLVVRKRTGRSVRIDLTALGATVSGA